MAQISKANTEETMFYTTNGLKIRLHKEFFLSTLDPQISFDTLCSYIEMSCRLDVILSTAVFFVLVCIGLNISHIELGVVILVAYLIGSIKKFCYPTLLDKSVFIPIYNIYSLSVKLYIMPVLVVVACVITQNYFALISLIAGKLVGLLLCISTLDLFINVPEKHRGIIPTDIEVCALKTLVYFSEESTSFNGIIAKYEQYLETIKS